MYIVCWEGVGGLEMMVGVGDGLASGYTTNNKKELIVFQFL